MRVASLATPPQRLLAQRVHAAAPRVHPANSDHCAGCFCYVCDVRASQVCEGWVVVSLVQCVSWTRTPRPHCNAHGDGTFWRKLRRLVVNLRTFPEFG